MITDFNTVESGSKLRTRACIVGGGAAGITLAKKLGAAGIPVILLESGGLLPDAASQSLNDGMSEGAPYLPLITTRLRYLGGTTNHWGGQSIPFDQLDFETRNWVPDSGWPITYNDFAVHLQEAASLCGLEFPRNGWDAAGVFHQIPANPFASRFRIANFQYSTPVTRFGTAYREELRNSDMVHCILNVNAMGLEVDKESGRVTSLSVTTLNGKKATVEATHFVLAAGSIENCRLLLCSPGTAGEGVGNEHDLVGRYFMEHPTYDSGEVILSGAAQASLLGKPSRFVAGRKVRQDLRLEDAAQRELGILNHSVFLKPTPGGGNEQVKTTGLWQKLIQWIEKSPPPDVRYQVRVRFEHAPNRDSRVTLNRNQVDSLGQPRPLLRMRFSELERKTIEAVHQELALALGREGIGRMRMATLSGDEWSRNLGWQYHQMGGTRMSTDPRHGVVNADCRVHSSPNLFIAGSSVFPTSGHCNPTLNLVALTLRLAHHLMQEMKS